VSASAAYWVAVAVGVVVCASLCAACRWRPGPWIAWAGRAISVLLAVDAVVFVFVPLTEGSWSVKATLPLALCNVALLVATVACWEPSWHLAVELTYFWGLAGALQAVVTPDLAAGFPQLEFFEFVVGHLGVVIAALYLVVGLRLQPRPGSVKRVFAVTAVYTAFVGWFDWLTGSNYMFLASRPATGSLLSVLGPWPWYILSATGVALILFWALDAPFHHRRLFGGHVTAGSRTRPVPRRDRARDVTPGYGGRNGTDDDA
jgi:hypothetical integral membrane protein (TIGR02206 family)